MWNSSSIQSIGKTRLTVRNCSNNKKYNESTIVNEDLQPILCKRTCEQMNLITVNYENIQAINEEKLLEQYNDIFKKEVGSLPEKVNLTVDDTINPVAIPSCRGPISMKKKVIAKLKDLKKQNVIAKVDEPTEWCSRMVATIKKNDDIRICIDPQVLNTALKREHHPLPILDDILPNLPKARIFSKFDLSNGYWHCILDEESSKLTTFQTPVGRYIWLRLPFGLAVSSEIFQKRLITALEFRKCSMRSRWPNRIRSW